MLVVGGLAVPGMVRAWVFTRLPQPQHAAMAVPTGLSSLSSTGCASCHVEVAREWSESRMAQAWTDPIFQADFERERELYACRTCHTPLQEQQPEHITGLASLKPVTGVGVPNPGYDEALRDEGVTCAACHVREGAVVGTIAGVEAPHAVTVDPTFGSADTCAPCHQAEGPPLSRLIRPVSDTLGEWSHWTEATGRMERCVDCHMPAVERPLTAFSPVRSTRSHRVLGGWDDDFVASAIRVDRVERTPDGVRVTVTNLAGHNVPTADPMRAIGLAASARVGGATLGSAPVWLEREVDTRRWVEGADSTLLPGETRAIPLRLPGLPDSLPAVEIEVRADRLRHADPSIRARFPGESVLVRHRMPLLPTPPPSETP